MAQDRAKKALEKRKKGFRNRDAHVLRDIGMGLIKTQGTLISDYEHNIVAFGRDLATANKMISQCKRIHANTEADLMRVQEEYAAVFSQVVLCQSEVAAAVKHEHETFSAYTENNELSKTLSVKVDSIDRKIKALEKNIEQFEIMIADMIKQRDQAKRNITNQYAQYMALLREQQQSLMGEIALKKMELGHFEKLESDRTNKLFEIRRKLNDLPQKVDEYQQRIRELRQRKKELLVQTRNVKKKLDKSLSEKNMLTERELLKIRLECESERQDITRNEQYITAELALTHARLKQTQDELQDLTKLQKELRHTRFPSLDVLLAELRGLYEQANQLAGTIKNSTQPSISEAHDQFTRQIDDLQKRKEALSQQKNMLHQKRNRLLADIEVSEKRSVELASLLIHQKDQTADAIARLQDAKDNKNDLSHLLQKQTEVVAHSKLQLEAALARRESIKGNLQIAAVDQDAVREDKAKMRTAISLGDSHPLGVPEAPEKASGAKIKFFDEGRGKSEKKQKMLRGGKISPV